ncbi:hypothetical protein AALP_AA6G359600 [Arabis alpina]|uniref:non-specific serine/threonine protein kinase n=1 Tax=Arabis alpina TaxID=50452 RepID=A0A087GTW7_ARAAL|nr:hypothetical protein AALP_AA6G359600 [Arabis alpina]
MGKDVVMTAAVPANASAPLTFTKDLEFPKDELYFYFHFSEVQALQANQTRENLSSSELTGTIATGIQNLTHLQKLDLSNNNLTGLVPEFLANMKSLMLIDLRNNKLNGSIPKTLRDREKKGLQLFVDDDKCLSSSCAPQKKFPVMIVALAASAVVVIAMVLILIYVFRKKKGSSHVEVMPPVDITTTSISGRLIETKRRRFTYPEIVEMTKNFQNALGEGGFGVVYHGYLNVSDQVAVKVLSHSSSQGYKHFKAEVELLLRVHHINLVGLVGYCDERDHLALIYEYMANGDLKDHLSGKQGDSFLKWTTRLRIAVDAALGLEYLHYGCRPSMVHRDVKSTNILLDGQFMAKIADFGLSRSFKVGDESQVSTAVAGTPGYLVPEYYRTSRLAEMSDVYSFGIVLLEIITNQHVFDQTREKLHIAEWVASALNGGDLTRIVDPNLHGQYNSRSLWRALELAMSCANPSSERRPNMSQCKSEASVKSRKFGMVAWIRPSRTASALDIIGEFDCCIRMDSNRWRTGSDCRIESQPRARIGTRRGVLRLGVEPLPSILESLGETFFSREGTAIVGLSQVPGERRGYDPDAQ